MSNHEAIVFDDRARAFVQARELIDEAQAMRKTWVEALDEDQDDDGAPDELPAEYWAAIEEAKVLAQLAGCDASVGMLAGAHAVNRKPERRAIRRDVRAALEARRATRPESMRGTNDVAPWAEGMPVTVTEGDYAGRRGQVYETHLDATPAQLTVELAPPGRPDDPSEPIVLTVLTSQVELVVE